MQVFRVMDSRRRQVYGRPGMVGLSDNVGIIRKSVDNTGCPRMFYTQKCKILRIFITIKTIEFGILIYLSDRAVLLAFWKILNQGKRPNETENTWHYVKRFIFCILIEMGK